MEIRKQTTFQEDVGKLLLDLGKLIFGAIFLGGILREEIPHRMLIIGGFLIAIALFFLGLLLLKKDLNV